MCCRGRNLFSRLDFLLLAFEMAKANNLLHISSNDQNMVHTNAITCLLLITVRYFLQDWKISVSKFLCFCKEKVTEAFSKFYTFFWVIPRRQKFLCRIFGTLCSIFIGRYGINMEQTQCFETSAYKIQTPGNYPEESI
jgi:hypothetical protein